AAWTWPHLGPYSHPHARALQFPLPASRNGLVGHHAVGVARAEVLQLDLIALRDRHVEPNHAVLARREILGNLLTAAIVQNDQVDVSEGVGDIALDDNLHIGVAGKLDELTFDVAAVDPDGVAARAGRAAEGQDEHDDDDGRGHDAADNAEDEAD